MKFILLLSLVISTSASAATYRCLTSFLRMELKTDPQFTTLLIQDSRSGEYYYHGVVAKTTDDGTHTKLKFETDFRTNLELEFRSDDYKDEAQKLYGFIKGQTNGGLVNTSFQCRQLDSI